MTEKNPVAVGVPAQDARAAPRLCIVGPMPPPEGGMANQTRQLAEMLTADGVCVEIVRTNAPYSPAWIGEVRGLRALARLLPYLWNLFVAFRRCDVVHLMANSGWAWHLFAAPALWIAMLCGRPVVVNYRGGEAEPFLRASARAVAWSMRRAARLVVPSGFLQGVFGRHGMQAEIIANIVDLERFRPTARPRRPGQHLVITRNLEPIYGIDTALRALALLKSQGFPDVTLSVAGVGPSLEGLRALAAELGVGEAVRFLGRLDRDQVVSLYHDADIAVNPSLVDNMPNSVLEALACGLPVVSTDVGGVPHVVQHESTALLVPPNDAQAMMQAIARVLHDDALREQLRAGGLRHAQCFGWPVVAPRWLQTYRELAALRAAGREYQAGG